MSQKRHERTAARRCAVQLLYTSEMQGKSPEEVLDEGLCLIYCDPLSDYALKLLRGTAANAAEIDERLASVSENWSVGRMPIVDRTILRLAVYEMLHEPSVPVSVSINEAVELAKDFGGEDDSPRFVNGVLGRIARQMEDEAQTASEQVAEPQVADPASEKRDSCEEAVIS